MAKFTLGKTSKPAFSAKELSALKAKGKAAILRDAKSDPDAQPLNVAQLRTVALSQRIRQLRERINATQAQFAKAYRIPVGTLRDLEQGRTEGDAVMAAYVTVIEANPKAVAKVLEERRRS
jgi:putative transcriptional regulator